MDQINVETQRIEGFRNRGEAYLKPLERLLFESKGRAWISIAGKFPELRTALLTTIVEYVIPLVPHAHWEWRPSTQYFITDILRRIGRITEAKQSLRTLSSMKGYAQDILALSANAYVNFGQLEEAERLREGQQQYVQDSINRAIVRGLIETKQEEHARQRLTDILPDSFREYNPFGWDDSGLTYVHLLARVGETTKALDVLYQKVKPRGRLCSLELGPLVDGHSNIIDALYRRGDASLADKLASETKDIIDRTRKFLKRNQSGIHMYCDDSFIFEYFRLYQATAKHSGNSTESIRRHLMRNKSKWKEDGYYWCKLADIRRVSGDFDGANEFVEHARTRSKRPYSDTLCDLYEKLGRHDDALACIQQESTVDSKLDACMGAARGIIVASAERDNTDKNSELS